MVLKVAIFWTSRSEAGLLAPVIKEMKALGIEVSTIEDTDFYAEAQRAKPYMFGHFYSAVYEWLDMPPKPDLVFASFDRPEMLMVAQAAHYLNIPVAQIHGGDVSREGSFDDQGRWAITALADLVFCNGWASFSRVWRIRSLSSDDQSLPHEESKGIYTTRGNGWVAHECGSTAFDDIELKKPGWLEGWDAFDFVVYNSPTARLDLIDPEIAELTSHLSDDTPFVWVVPGGDPGSDKIMALAKDWLSGHRLGMFANTLPREEFLWCLKNARRLIGNSSSFWVEMPTLRGSTDGFIPIGTRNKGRDFIYARRGASKRIAEIVSHFLEGKSQQRGVS